MTVVSAMKFNFHQGALVCDEQTTFGDNRYAYLSDKIKPLIPPEVTERTGMVAAYGGSGTQSVAAEVVKKTYGEMLQAAEDIKPFSHKSYMFRTIEDVARFSMKKLLEVKHHHLNDKLYSNFHFNMDDFNRGYYELDGERYDIKQDNVIEKATEYITWKDYQPDVDSIFKNRAIVAGFDPTSGFEIYSLSLMDNECFFSGGLYESIGSGADIASISLNDFINTKVLSIRRTKIDPTEGVVELIRATNACARRNYGVGGYFNIVLIDGRKSPEKAYTEIMDHSARLASEIVFAGGYELIDHNDMMTLINKLVFKGVPFADVDSEFCKMAKDTKKLSLLLRGYKLERLFNNNGKDEKTDEDSGCC
ncbi:MAG: hypothetical protein K8T10_04410 [Candidatus Eremiobacteraeota bacterium]|nr:hypothetical protein [Candidatus Eremiobacteraeota bacterium]